jgi:hypothetical protein
MALHKGARRDMANIGYYSMTAGQGDSDMRDDIIAAGHNPVLITEPDASQLAGLDALYVWNGSNKGYNAVFTNNMSAISDAVHGGMNMVVFDRAIGVANPQDILPGTKLTHMRALTRGADLTEAGEGSVGHGAGGVITDASIDGGNYTTHGYVTAATLPAGATVLMTLDGGDESKAVGFVYDFGAGSVQFYGIPMDYYNEKSQAWENFATNTLEFAAMCLGQGARVLTDQGYRPVESLVAGQLIWTQDHGMQPLRALVTSVAGAVVLLPKGALGNRRALVLSSQHRICLRGAYVELFAGLTEAFAVASHLVGLVGLRKEERPGHLLYNLLFEKHEVIVVEGILLESLYLCLVTRMAMGKEARRATLNQNTMVLARPELPRATARAVVAAMGGKLRSDRYMVA